MLVIGLTACAGGGTAGTPSPDGTPQGTPTPLTAPDDGIVIQGQVLQIGTVMTDAILEAFGTPSDTQKAPSCHFDGEDTIYIYDGFSLYTYADGDDSILYLIEISKAGIATPKGAQVGMTLEEVKQLYGDDYTELGTAISYALSDTTALRFSFDGTAITMMEFEEN